MAMRKAVPKKALKAPKIIRRVRRRMELSQEALSRALHATKGAIRHRERGRNNPDLARLLALRELCPPGPERKDLDALIKQIQSQVVPLPNGPSKAAAPPIAGVAFSLLKYLVEDPSAISGFIKRNRVIEGLLMEAQGPLNAAFGQESIKKLTLVEDDEGFVTLFCFIMVPGDLENARRALNSFDQSWWLARSHEAHGKLNFDFELI